jgi:hypothetical protein
MPNQTDDAYHTGFNDGLKWVAECLRRAAIAVESPTYTDFERKPTNGGEARVFRGIAKTGRVHFANQLRSVADEIEKAIKKAKPDGTQT